MKNIKPTSPQDHKESNSSYEQDEGMLSDEALEAIKLIVPQKYFKTSESLF